MQPFWEGSTGDVLLHTLQVSFTHAMRIDVTTAAQYAQAIHSLVSKHSNTTSS